MKSDKMKSYYRILLTATSAVSVSVLVHAETEEEAKAKAIQLAREGDVVWSYDGCDASTIEAVETIWKGLIGRDTK